MIEFNGKKMCENCFEEITSQPCPQCGFDPAVPHADHNVLKPGSILLGKYIVGRTIGKGGFGITYLAYDTTTGKKAAIKEYYPVRLPDSKQRVKLAEGQDIHGKVFAGYGTSHDIRDRYKVAARNHIPFEEAHKLQKASGNGYIIANGAKRMAELHRYQMSGDKYEEKFDMKVKRFIDEDKV